jgi:hypothetical protein
MADIKIVDNYNNTFSVTGSSSQDLRWGYSTNYGNTVSNPNKLTIVTPTAATRRVYAKSNTAGVTAHKDIEQYVAPKMSGQPYIVQYALGDRLTADVPWNWTWEAAKPANNSSPVRGYRIRLYKNGSLVTGLSVNKSTDGSHYLVKGNGTNEYIDYEGHDNTNLNTHKRLTIANPAGTFGFKAGDTVKLGLFAYSKNGLDEIQWSAGGQWNNLFSGNATSQTNSSIYTIENKGIMRVKVNGVWKEGQVYVKTGGSWKEAQGVYTKVNGSWKEST